MKSHIMSQKDELMAYSLLGIPRNNIVKMYAMEMAWITLRVALPVILLCFLVIKGIAAIPSLEWYLYLPWWIAFVLIFVQVLFIFVIMEDERYENK